MGKARAVKSIDLDGNIEYYKSASAAAKVTTAIRREISNVCNKKKRSAGRLLWAFADEDFILDNLYYLKSYDTIYRERAKKLFGDTYTYQREEIPNSDYMVEITCNICGNTFKQRANMHTAGKGGCRPCSERASRDNQLRSLEDTLSIFKAVHGDKYDYSLITEPKGYDEKVKIICSIHGIFEQRVGCHSIGRGCRRCAGGGFNSLKPAILYYLKVTNHNKTAYKIGITNKSVSERYSSKDMENIQVLKTWNYPVGADAFKAEQQILKENKGFKYTGQPLLESGNTELFSIDIGGYDV